MRHYFTILAHEVRMLLVSPSTYIAAVLFLLTMGLVFVSILEEFSTSPQQQSPAIIFFNYFFLPVFFMVPMLTMKSISEERRHGTLETLLTTPVTTGEVVLGKYSAAYLLYVLLWGATGGFFYILYRFAKDVRFLDPGPLIGGYVFIAVSGLLFIALGVLASALSRNQAVAGLLAFVFLFALLAGTNFLAQTTALETDLLAPVRSAVEYAQVFTHLEDFTRGVVDTRQLLFYLSGTVLTLIFSILALEGKRLHS